MSGILSSPYLLVRLAFADEARSSPSTARDISARTVGLHPDLGKMLFWWKSTSAGRVRVHKESRSEYVATCKGDQIASAERALRSAYKKAGLSSERPFHTLRHSFGTFLAMEGVSLYDISKLMGHTFEDVTQLYTHLQPEHLNKQVAKIPAIVLKKSSVNEPVETKQATVRSFRRF